MDFFKFIKELQIEFQKPLPGKEVQYEMASSFRHLLAQPDETSRESGVLILLFPKNNSIQSVLIKRAENKDVHSGQISFPGGGYEYSDKDINFTALRETQEEIGIDISKVNIIGQLTPLFIPVSNNNVFPVVGYSSQPPLYKNDPHEVEYGIEFDVLSLLKTDAIKTTVKELFNTEITIKYYDIKQHVVWGATAMILHEFLALVKKISY